MVFLCIACKIASLRPLPRHGLLEIWSIIPNTAVLGPTNFVGTARTKDDWMKKEDFYGGRTGPLEKFYFIFYFLLI